MTAALGDGGQGQNGCCGMEETRPRRPNAPCINAPCTNARCISARSDRRLEGCKAERHCGRSGEDAGRGSLQRAMQPHPARAGRQDAGAGQGCRSGAERERGDKAGSGRVAGGTHGQAGAQHDHVVGLVHDARCGAASPRPPQRSQDGASALAAPPDPSAGKGVAGGRSLRRGEPPARRSTRQRRRVCACAKYSPPLLSLHGSEEKVEK